METDLGESMDFFETVQNRHSYRKEMVQTEVPLEDLKKIVQAGLDAPSGKNEQTTEFVIIKDPEAVRSIQQMPQANKAMATAPAFIACHMAKDPEKTYFGMSFDVEDCAAAVENILLAASALQYGSVWIDGWLRLESRAEAIGDIIGLDSSRIIRILLPIGKMTVSQKRPLKKSFDERVRIV